MKTPTNLLEIVKIPVHVLSVKSTRRNKSRAWSQSDTTLCLGVAEIYTFALLEKKLGW